MKIRILAVGRCKEPFIQAGLDEYVKRLKRFVPVEVVVLKDRGMKDEADDILSRLKDETVIVLSEEGVHFDSIQFSKLFSPSQKDVVFVLGSAEGLDPSVKQRADMVLSLSSMTFTHEMARLFLIEQIYRAQTIRAGLKYHR